VTHIEVFFGVLVFIFGLIGLVRGFLKELGVTTVMLFVLFFLNLSEQRLGGGLTKLAGMLGKVAGTTDSNLVQTWFFIIVIVGAAFISYQGETLAYGGKAPPGVYGAILGWLTGLLNGYLIAGSIWYYMDKLNYPIKWLGFTKDQLSSLAKTLVGFLPTAFLGREIVSNVNLLLILTALLLLARVIR